MTSNKIMSKEMPTGAPTPEEIAKIEKQRTISDANFLKGGAEYKVNERGEKILEPTEKQIKKIEKDIESEKKLAELKKMFNEKSIEINDEISIYLNDGSKLEGFDFLGFSDEKCGVKIPMLKKNYAGYEIPSETIVPVSKIKEIKRWEDD